MAGGSAFLTVLHLDDPSVLWRCRLQSWDGNSSALLVFTLRRLVHLVVWSERASRDRPLFGERGDSASLGTILKGGTLSKLTSLVSFSVICIFSILAPASLCRWLMRLFLLLPWKLILYSFTGEYSTRCKKPEQGGSQLDFLSYWLIKRVTHSSDCTGDGRQWGFPCFILWADWPGSYV